MAAGPTSPARRALATGVAAAAVACCVASPAVASTIRPVLGDWEGVAGGHPASLEVRAVRGRTTVTDVVYESPACTRGLYGLEVLTPNWAVTASGGFGFPPLASGRHLLTSGYGGYFRSSRSGRLLVASKTPTTSGGCRRPAFRQSWALRPARRVPVADGNWHGSVAPSGPVSAGSVDITTTAHGRLLSSLSVQLQTACATGGGNFSFSTGLRFITAAGTSSATFDAGGATITFTTRFSSGHDAGSFTVSGSGDMCSPTLSGTWTASAA